MKSFLEFIKRNEDYLGSACLKRCVPAGYFLEKTKAEIIKCLMNSVRDFFGIDHVFNLYYFNQIAFDDYSIMFMECIQEDTETFTNFVLEGNEYGHTRLLGAMKLSLTSNLLKEFVAILCEQPDPNILEDLAITLVYRDHIYYRDIETILKIVDSNSAMHAKIELIQDNVDKIEKRQL
ncbi:MAG: hypothetical protein EOO01_03560, partial [Chitinophagaceae bacterium]